MALEAQINIKIDKKDKEKIEGKARAAGLSTGAYMKIMALNGDIAIVKAKR